MTGGGDFNFLEIESVLSSIRIELTSHSIRVALKENILLPIEILDVLVGPFDLSLNTVNSGHVLNYPNTSGKMEDQKKPTQKTPKGHEIPIPTKEDFMHDLENASELRKIPKSHHDPLADRRRAAKKVDFSSLRWLYLHAD